MSKHKVTLEFDTETGEFSTVASTNNDPIQEQVEVLAGNIANLLNKMYRKGE